MNPHLNQLLVQQRNAELRRAAEHGRLGSELPTAVQGRGFILRGEHLAKLDRFLDQARRAAQRADRDFDGVMVEIHAEGVVSVHATGMTPMVL